MPGSARIAASARSRTGSHCFTAPASTVMEKNTLPSVTTMSDRVPVSVSGLPSGLATPASVARTSSLIDAILTLPALCRLDRTAGIAVNRRLSYGPATAAGPLGSHLGVTEYGATLI